MDFRPNDTRTVQIRVDGRWLYGTLEGFGPGPDNTWRGLVRWSEYRSREHRQWFDESEIRPLQV